MAFNAGTVQGSLALDTNAFVAALTRAEQALGRIDGSAQKTAGGITGFVGRLSQVGNILAGLQSGLQLTSSAINGLIAPFKAAVGIAGEYEQVVRRLAVQLKLSGETGVRELTQDLEDFAGVIQRTTAFDDTDALIASSTLSRLGVAGEQLQTATKAVLDYAAATGTDAATAAEQFGRTLDGTAGRLQEALPQVRGLSEEALKAGEAFDLAAELFGGASEEIAQTTLGSLTQLQNAFSDLIKEVGFDLNPAVTAIAKGLQEVVVQATDAVASTDTVSNFANETAQGIAEFIRDAGDSLLDLPAFISELEASFNDVLATIVSGSSQVDIAIREIGLTTQQVIASILQGLADLPGIGSAFSEAAQTTASVAIEMAESLAQARAGAESLRAPFDQAAEAARATAAAQREAADAVREGAADGGVLGAVFRGAATAADSITAALGQAQDRLAGVTDGTGNWSRDLKEIQGRWDKVLGITRDARGYIQAVEGATEGAAAAADSLEGGMDGAADAFERAAAAAGETASATEEAASAASGLGGGVSPGGGGTGPFSGEGRGVIGSSSLPTDPFGAVAAAAAARDSQRAVTNGIANALAGGFLDRTAARFADDVSRYAEGLVNQAVASFTANVISQLNQSGVSDPAERSRIVKARVAEAQRTGALPSTGGAGTNGQLRSGAGQTRGL